jgi:prepilin-type N-terminal cleavage/methylation domain-containing protein/prepilin-type processing-associated H-X9-DG protein
MSFPRRGFSLVELVVVTAIISVLVALLLPAVQKVRAAADRVQCGNNLKQLGLALHAYHDANVSLPPGVTSEKPGELYPRMSWMTRLLPYLEQGTLWKATLGAYAYEPSPYVNPPHVGLAMPVRVFACPADPRMFEPHDTFLDLRVASTSYLGVLGTAYGSTDGVLFVDSRVRWRDITDGMSNTAMVGERPPSLDFWFGWWYAGYGQAGTGSGDMVLGARERNSGIDPVRDCPAGPYHFQDGRLEEPCDVFHFWSMHPDGGYFLFADGSVHFLNYSADRLLPALATRAGGEPVTSPD